MKRVVLSLLKKAVESDLSATEHTTLMERSDWWSQSALGENRAALKRKGYRFYGSIPKAQKLIYLDSRFTKLVSQKAYSSALAIYNQIRRLAKNPGYKVGRPEKQALYQIRPR